MTHKIVHFSLLLIALLLSYQCYSNPGIVQPYSGRINCATLDQDISNFSELLVGRFCRRASDACELQRMHNKLDRKNPLSAILNDRLQDYLNLQIEICEMAFAVNAPEFYQRNLSRTQNHNTTPLSSFDRTIAITPTYIE